MATWNKRRQEIVAEASREFRKLPNRTVATILHAKYPKLFETHEAARAAVRFVRGNIGSKMRAKAADKSGFRPSGSQSDRVPIPPSLCEPWLPFIIEARRTLSISDLHCPFHDPEALEVALDHGEDFEPDAVLINGDLVDFEDISKFDRSGAGPTTDEELACTKQTLQHIRQRFPHADLYFKFGNHDERWLRYFLRRAPEVLAKSKTLSDAIDKVWQDAIGITDFGVTVISDGRPVMCGKLPIFHGHEPQKGFTAPVNPARGVFLKLLASCLVSHHHRQSEHDEMPFGGEVISCRSQACLCDLRQKYARINKWQSGFATIEVHPDGGYELELKKIIKGKVR